MSYAHLAEEFLFCPWPRACRVLAVWVGVQVSFGPPSESTECLAVEQGETGVGMSPRGSLFLPWSCWDAALLGKAFPKKTKEGSPLSGLAHPVPLLPVFPLPTIV